MLQTAKFNQPASGAFAPGQYGKIDVTVGRSLPLGGIALVALALLAILGPWQGGWLALLGGAIGLLAAVFLFLIRDYERLRRAVEPLRQSNEQLEAQGRTTEARWRSIVESAVDGIVVIDARGRIEAFNPAAERLFGYSEADVLGHNVKMLMPQPYRDQHDGYIARYLDTGEQKIIGIGREVVGERRDGSTFPLHLSVGEITIGGEKKFTGIVHDLSARVAMEQQLREQTTLARLGEMAAVIAHEVKNPLAGVRGAIQVIGARMAVESRDAAMLKEIVARIDALNGLMEDLLLFARPPSPRPAPVDLVPLVSTTADLLIKDPALRDLRITVEGSAPPISVDPEMLRIVLQNLLVNSAYAMQGRGTITVGITMVDATCQIAIADAGPGIEPEVREKIFDAFFTTKARGSGLGLPTAKRLIEAHNGRIQVDCPPAGGTVVTIQLPMRPA